MKRRIVVILLLIVVIAAIAIKLSSNKKKIDANKVVVNRSEIPVNVSVYNVQALPIKGNLEIPAVLESFEYAIISSTVAGKIETLNIELGNNVSQGQIIGTIDSKVKILNLKALEVNLSKAKQDYERNIELFKGKAIQEVELNNSKFLYENYSLQVEQLKQQIADANIISPINGIIVEKQAVAGEFVNMGVKIAKVVNNNKLKAVVYVGEKDVYKLRIGQTTSVTCEVLNNQTFNGTITFISAAGDENHNYRVEISLNNTKQSVLKSGTYVKVNFKMGGQGMAMQIPKTALVDGVKNPFVYLVENKKAVSRKIVLGREIGEFVEVYSGLKLGDNVVLDGIINIVEGSNLNVLNQ